MPSVTSGYRPREDAPPKGEHIQGSSSHPTTHTRALARSYAGTMHPVVRRLLAVAATAVVAALALTGCGGGEDHVALAIQRAERVDGGVTFTVECADAVEVAVRPDPEGSGLQQVTVWGDPKVGTCVPDARTSEVEADRFVDAATSQVVTVDDPCQSTPESC